MIVGIAGRKRSGKDTLGQALVKEGFVRVAFADMLKDLVAEILDLHPSEGRGHRFSEEAWTAMKEVPLAYLVGHGGMHEHTGRTLLQRVGLAVRRVLGEDTWVNAALAKCSDDRDYVITDMRFGNEFRAIKKAGGRIIRLNRWESLTTLHDFQGDLKAYNCSWKHPSLPDEPACGLPPGLHPTSWSDDRHPSENGLPDVPNNAYRYDAAFTGSMEANTAAALERVREWRRG